MANTIRLKRGTTEPTAGNLVTGELAINTGDATVYTKLDDGTVSTIVGKSNNLFVAVRNESGSTIPAGSAVYISGASNGKPLITLAQANSEASSSKTLGLTVASIATNANGEVIATGLLTKINTQSYAAGDVLWLSPTVAGGFTTTKPSAPNHAVFIGTVLSSANNGKIEVKVQNGFELQELHNVSISGLADKDIISYNSTTGLYENQTATELGLAPLSNPTFTGTVTIPAGASISGFAPLASPTFTGTPLAPTASAGTNTTQVATTAFVTTAISTKANLASPALTGTPTAPTATTATNSTQIATTAYVKNQAYATLASPQLTGSPTAPTQSWSVESTAIANTSFVKTQNRKQNYPFYNSLNTTGTLFENFVYQSTGSGEHIIYLPEAGFYNTNGSKFMFRQNDNAQMDFYDTNGYVKAPNNDRYYAAFPGAVIFAVKVSTYDWFIYGDLISTQYPVYGTLISGPAIDTTNTVNSGYTDYYGNTVYAYTAYVTIADGWGGQTNVAATADPGTVMSDNFTYSMDTETYNLLADGSGGYTLNFVSSSGGGGGGGYDPYGTKYGNPYWDSGSGSLLQSIADGGGGSTTIAWDGIAPYPVYGEQVSTTSYGQGGNKTDAIGNSYYVYYDSTYYADGNGGSYESWSISSGYSYPADWAFDNYHFNTGVPNTSYYFYDEYSNTVYPWTWGYNAADGTGNTYFLATGTPPSGEPASDYFTDNNYNYGRIYADGSGGFYFAS